MPASLVPPYASIVNPFMPVIAEEMADSDFAKSAATGITLNIDPASNVIATRSLAGIKLTAPVAAASDATTFSYDAVGKKLNLAIDGNTVQTVDLAALDNEGAKLVINGQNLELVAEDGTVLSSTPITAIDAQQLTSAVAANTLTITLSNGGDVDITCTEISALYPAKVGPVPTTVSFLADDCGKYTMADILDQAAADNPPQVLSAINTSLVQGGQFELSGGGGIITFDAITCADIKSLFPAGGTATAATTLFTGDCKSITVADITALAAVATTNTLTVTGGNLVSNVNGVVASVPLSDIVNTTTIDAAYTAAPAAPAAGAKIYGPGGKTYNLVQDTSATGILLPTWSVR
jgi:hypothetical protein